MSLSKTSNPKSAIQNLKFTTLTPDQLAEVLTNLPAGIKLNLETLPTGEIRVSHGPETKEGIIARHYDHLRSQPITVTEAVERYEVPKSTLIAWKNTGNVTVLEAGYRLTLDEADVAACAHVYRRRDGLSGVPLFDEEGRVYQLKHPRLAAKRRRERGR